MSNDETSNATFSLWEKEYRTAGIPSSVRDRPSNAVLEFLAFIETQGLSPTHALDIGCGRGRNALELARRGMSVVALDGVPSCVEDVNRTATEHGLGSLAAHCIDLRDPWPCADASIDLAVDCFCFKHVVDLDGIDRYRQNLYRVLRPGAFFLLTCADPTDGYYGAAPLERSDGPGVLITDPANRIASRLYTIADIAGIFSELSLERSFLRSSRNDMHGATYERATVTCYFRR